LNGTIVDYSICNYGTVNDERASVDILMRHRSPATNPLKLGLVLDSGWKARETFTDGSDGRPQVTRPLTALDVVDPSVREALERASANLVVFRQSNEHGNGGLKRAFPILIMPVRYDDRPRLERDMEMCIRLWNMKTRVVGWNQINTTYMRHADADFADVLKAGNTLEAHMELRARRFQELLGQGML